MIERRLLLRKVDKKLKYDYQVHIVEHSEKKKKGCGAEARKFDDEKASSNSQPKIKVT